MIDFGLVFDSIKLNLVGYTRNSRDLLSSLLSKTSLKVFNH